MKRTRRAIVVIIVLLVGGRASAADGDEDSAITFSEAVQPILLKSCVTCHQPGQIGPMSLRTYAEVRPWARSIKQAVTRREMPPFHATGPIGHYVNDPRLTDQEISTIVQWVDAGCPPGPAKEVEGGPAEATEGEAGWALGEPDIVLTTQPYEVRVGAGDDYTAHFFTFEFPEDLWVDRVELIHSDYRLVHHANLATLKAPDAIEAQAVEASKPAKGDSFDILRRKQAQRSRLPELRNLIRKIENGEIDHFSDIPSAFNTTTSITGMPLYGWTPGTDPRLAAGSPPKLIPKGTRLLLDCHYAPQDEPATSVTRVGIHLYDGEITEQYGGDMSILPAEAPIRIAPGQAEYMRTYEHVLQTDALIDTFSLHMHYRGKSGSVTLVYPDQRTVKIFDVPRYDFNWQRTYRLAKPIYAPKGSRLIHTAVWDNSASNPHNPDPSQLVLGGMRTTDEMWASAVGYTIPGGLETPIRIEKGRAVAAGGQVHRPGAETRTAAR